MARWKGFVDGLASLARAQSAPVAKRRRRDVALSWESLEGRITLSSITVGQGSGGSGSTGVQINQGSGGGSQQGSGGCSGGSQQGSGGGSGQQQGSGGCAGGGGGSQQGSGSSTGGNVAQHNVGGHSHH